MKSLTVTARRLADVLERENAALRVMDLRRVTALLPEKSAAVAELNASGEVSCQPGETFTHGGRHHPVLLGPGPSIGRSRKGSSVLGERDPGVGPQDDGQRIVGGFRNQGFGPLVSDPDLTAIVRRLEALAQENRGLLERAMVAQRRVIGIIVRAAASASAGPNYRAPGRPDRSRRPLTLSTRA